MMADPDRFVSSEQTHQRRKQMGFTSGRSLAALHAGSHFAGKKGK